VVAGGLALTGCSDDGTEPLGAHNQTTDDNDSDTEKPGKSADRT
jgi:hypothetical protein